MSNETFKVRNIKCGGCASAIQEGLSGLSGVNAVEVDIESGQVHVSGEQLVRANHAAKLAELGYPEV